MSELLVHRSNNSGTGSGEDYHVLSDLQIAEAFPGPLILPAETIQHDSPKIISRREFLRNSGDRLAGLVALAAVAQYGALAETISETASSIGRYEDELWPENEPSLTFLDGASYTGQKVVTIYLPGFGDIRSLEEAETWKQASGLPKDHLTGAIDYSNQGATIEQIVATIQSCIDVTQVEQINFVCRSIGGLYVLPIIAELGIPVGSIQLISSPSRLSYGDFGSFGKYVAHAPQDRDIATAVKLGFNAWLAARKNKIKIPLNAGQVGQANQNLALIPAQAWRATMKNANPLALETELKTAAPIDILDRALLRKLRKCILPGITRVDYAATNHPHTDGTVLVVPSSREFVRAFAELGIKCTRTGVPYDGHANVEATAAYMKQQTLLLGEPSTAKNKRPK